MKVALVHDFLVKLGGGERVLKALADMFPKAPIYTLFYDKDKVGDVFPGMETAHKQEIRTSLCYIIPDLISLFRRKWMELFIGSIISQIHQVLVHVILVDDVPP